MAELITPKRVLFPPSEQHAFILQCKNRLGLSSKELAQLVGVTRRSFNDWQREKLSMQLPAVEMLANACKIGFPKRAKIQDPFWYVHKGAHLGGLTVYKKYGRVGGNNLERWRKQWHEWWETTGQYKPHPLINTTKPIKKPRKSKDLAEFIGILLGDGGITTNQITITLHDYDDFEYGKFIISLIKKLFGLTPSIIHDKHAAVNDYTISRTKLVKFCTQEWGLKIGSKVKQQVDIPNWVKSNQKFYIACVRGLVDTDGCIFTHRYRVNGKEYTYKKLSFSNRSLPIIWSVQKLLLNLGLRPRLAENNWDVRLDSITDLKKYFELVGSHNPKHLQRYSH